MSAADDDMIMVGHAYGPAVVHALCDLPGRKLPRAALGTYTSLLCEIAPDSGELLCSLDRLAERVRIKLPELEGVVLHLARLRVIVHDPRRADDVWCINPHLAWKGSLEARARFAALVPPPAVEPLEGDAD